MTENSDDHHSLLFPVGENCGTRGRLIRERETGMIKQTIRKQNGFILHKLLDQGKIDESREDTLLPMACLEA